MKDWETTEERRTYGRDIFAVVECVCGQWSWALREDGEPVRIRESAATREDARRACDAAALQIFRTRMDADRVRLLAEVAHHYDNPVLALEFVRQENPVLAVNVLTHAALNEVDYRPMPELLPVYYALFDWLQGKGALPNMKEHEGKQGWSIPRLLVRSAENCLNARADGFNIFYLFNAMLGGIFDVKKPDPRGMKVFHRGIMTRPRKP